MQPSLALCLGRFYRRHELVLRVNLLLGAAIASGAFGGLLYVAFIVPGRRLQVGPDEADSHTTGRAASCMLGLLEHKLCLTARHGGRSFSARA